MFKISLNSLIIAFSKTIDFLDKRLHAHHWNVAYIAMRIAEKLNCTPKQIQNVIQASLLHDIGVFKTDDRKKLLDYVEIETVGHEEIGAILLEQSALLTHLIPIIRYHHQAYSARTADTPIESQIIYLADRIAVLMDNETGGKSLYQYIVDQIIVDRGTRFNPQAVDAFVALSQHKAFWLDIQFKRQEARIRQGLIEDEIVTSFERLKSIGRLFITAVDFRSRYTASHSYGVAAIAREIGYLMEFSQENQNLLELTGFYHDIGKIAIPKEILDKPSKLTREEMDLIASHSYFTHDILSRVEGLAPYAYIASYHHEAPSGKGYPFGLAGESLDILSRIVSVADVFSAITEDRPYRSSINKQTTRRILNNRANSEMLDRAVVDVVLSNFDFLYEKNRLQQDKALAEFKAFEQKVYERTGIVIT